MEEMVNSIANINLSKEKYEIKKYATFGLIKFSEHAKVRMKERGYSPYQIYEYLTEKNTSIVQYKEPGTYNNTYPRFVMCGKINKKPMHIVVEKIQKGDIKRYEVVTVYEPNKKFFYQNGKVVKKAKDRK